MFNDVVVTLVQLIESSESSASVSIFSIILEAPAHQCPSGTSCSFCLLGKVACNIQTFAQLIYYGTISHLETDSYRETHAVNMLNIEMAQH